MDGLVPGRVVYFVLSVQDAAQITLDRLPNDQLFRCVQPRGSTVHPGEVYPAIVVRAWDLASGLVNLKVLLDGTDTYWATSVEYDATQRTGHTWHWMFDGQQTRYTPDRTAKAAEGSD